MSINIFFNRAKNMILIPPIEWVRIESELNTRKQILKEYILPFVIVYTICSFTGASLFSLQPYSITLITLKTIISALFIIGGIYLSAVIINELAISFGIHKNLDSTFKLVTYSSTSFFIAICLVGLLPDMPIFLILALHSIYLFWIGTSVILKTPETNKVGFVVVSLLIIVGIYAIFSLIVGTVVTGMIYVSQPIL